MNRPRSDPASALLQNSLAEALACLAVRGKADTRIHTARKALKRARAALRLLRPALAADVYERENRALRDAGRCLSPLRDARSLVVVIDTLATSCDLAAAATAVLPPVREVLVARLDEARHAFADPVTWRGCADLVRGCRERLRRDVPSRVGASMLLDGLRKIYSKARKSLALATSEHTPAALHEWRKRTKYLQTAAKACGAGAPHLRKLVERTDDIAAWLGDDHDLGTLRLEIERFAMPELDADAILGCIDDRRAKLQLDALTCGARAFRKKPGRFVARLSAR